MSQSRTFRIVDVGAYLGISHQRAEQMFHGGKFPKPVRRHRPSMEASNYRAVGRAGVVGNPALEKGGLR